MKRFLNHLLVAVGAFASLLTMISFFFSIQWNNCLCLTWMVFIIIIIVCIIYASAQVSRKKKIDIRISENFQLSVEEGNLFDQKGVMVIPVNNYFDTHVGDGIIDPKSVHGQFINKLFRNRLEELDQKIANSIKSQRLQGDEVASRINGKNMRYNLGDCADVMDGGNRYVWVVTTEFDSNNIACLERENLSKVVSGLFNHLETVAGNDVVYIPVIGAGNARLNRSAERILHYLIDYFDFSLSEKKILGGVHVVIPSVKNIDLGRIESIFERREK